MNEQPPFFVTWCRSQDAFHTETADEMLTNNLNNFFDRYPDPPDWIVVGMAMSRHEAILLAKELRRRKALRATGREDAPEPMGAVPVSEVIAALRRAVL